MEISFKHNSVESIRPVSTILIIVCFYLFLYIERPWESIRYLNDIPIERMFAIIMIVVAFLNNKFKIVNSPTNKWVYGLLALHFVLAPFSFNPSDSVDQGIEYGKMVVLYLLMVAVSDDDESLKIIIKVFIFSMMFYLLHSLWEYHNGRHDYKMGITRMIGVDSKSNDPNTFGASVVLSLPFVYALLRSEMNTILCWLYKIYSALVVLCVVLTGSRSASVALFALLLLWGLLQKGRRKFIKLFLFVLVVGGVWVSMPFEKQNRIRTIWDKNAGPNSEAASSSAEGRIFGFKAGWEMFIRHPLTGIGAGGKNFVAYRVQFLDGIPEQAHNTYAEVLGEHGVGGAILFTGLVGTILWCCLDSRQKLIELKRDNTFLFFLCGAITACVLLLLLLGLAGHNFYRPLWLWLAAWSGSMHVLLALKQKQQITDEQC